MEELDKSKMKKALQSILSVKNLANFSKDWLVRFISLFLAVILWLVVGGEDKVDKNVMIPVEIINLPRDLVISNQFKKEIEVTVSGPRSLILEMSNKIVTRQVDLSAATPGSMVVSNENDHIDVPRGITVQRVQPSSIILSLDKLIQKKYPVIAKTTGRVAQGYFVKSLVTEPDVITITGPQTILQQFDELFTKEIDLNGVQNSVQVQVPLELGSAVVELIGETSVTVDLTVGLKTETVSMKAMKVEVNIDGVSHRVEPGTVRVTANIPKLLLKKGLDPRTLLAVTAAQQDEDEQLKVMVIPKAEVEYPIEVLSVIPQTVKLIDGADSPRGGKSKARELAEPEIIIKTDTEEGEEDFKSADKQVIPILNNTKKKKYMAQ